jgi:hypothetical protein
LSLVTGLGGILDVLDIKDRNHGSELHADDDRIHHEINTYYDN